MRFIISREISISNGTLCKKIIRVNTRGEYLYRIASTAKFTHICLQAINRRVESVVSLSALVIISFKRGTCKEPKYTRAGTRCSSRYTRARDTLYKIRSLVSREVCYTFGVYRIPRKLSLSLPLSCKLNYTITNSARKSPSSPCVAYVPYENLFGLLKCIARDYLRG